MKTPHTPSDMRSDSLACGYVPPESEPHHNSQRAVQCVNACAGIEDPTATLQAVREALAFVISHHNLDCESCLDTIHNALELLTPKRVLLPLDSVGH
jgi:hypothetical protein